MTDTRIRFGILAWPLACLAISLAGLVRADAVENQTLAYGAFISGALSILLSVRHWKVATVPVSLYGLIVLHGLILAAIWKLLPVSESQATGVTALLAVLVVTVWLARRNAAMPEPSRDFDAGYAPMDTAIVLLPVALVVYLDGGVQASQLADKYPATLLKFLVIAWLQLYLFLDLPVRVLRKSSAAPGLVSLACAGVFALVHLPNPLLMTFTGLLMWVLSWQYQRGRSLLVLAVLMALTPTTIEIAVPEQFNGDFRIGSEYLEHTAVP